MPVPLGVKAGKISKPNGLQGHVNMILDHEAGLYIETNHPLFIDIDGQRVPFFVEDIELVSDDLAIVQFQFIENIEQAREVSGCEVFFGPKQRAAAQRPVNDLSAVIGYDSFDQNVGYLGKVTNYVEAEFNPVLMIDYNGKELIVPAVDELIQNINHKEQSIHFHLPDGLITL